ncbi:MAG: TonB-dependent receptor [Acidobacteriota bacterium]|jgi:outer membrane receptor protein involved in Fe transport|nr:TonB-dependent receptor [Acidobacteriota bacterium]
MRSTSVLKTGTLLLLVCVCTAGAAAAASLEGTILDPNGQPIPGASVSLLRGLVVIDQRQTNAEGVYRFDGLQAGAYQLAASARALSAPPVDIALGKDENRKQDMRLALSALESQVVVSASLGGALMPQIGSSVSLATLQDIEERGAQSALEVIRGIPGVEVNQTGRRGGVTGIHIRGGESKYNAVMVDGMQLNEFGGAFDMAAIPADGIERIEITRGPQSALYGSNAVTGAINVVSRRGEGPPKFTALAEGGSHYTRRFATGGSGLTRGFSWAYDLSRLDSDGAVANDNYRTQSAFLSLGYSQARRQLRFGFFGNANHSGAPGPYGSDPAGTFTGIDTVSRGKQNLFGYQLGYTEQISSRVRQVSTVSLTTNDLFYHLNLWGDYRAESLRGVFNTRSEITLSNTDTLAAGFEFNREQIRHDYITDSQFSPFLLPRTSLAYFVENRWSPSDRLYLIAGIRFDNLRTHSIPPDAWGSRPFIPESSIVKANPRISAAYIAREGDSDGLVGGTRIHGSFGTGIRPPDGFELAFTNNPELKPERSISFDAGMEQRLFSNRAVVDFTYFFNRFEDQIVTLGGSLQNLSQYTSDNLKNSRAQGFELSFRINPLQSLELGGQYTFLDTTVLALDGSNLANAPYQVGQELLRRPRHSASYNIAWRHKRLTLSTHAYLRGAVLDAEPAFGSPFYTNKGYVRADAGLSYRLPKGVEIYGRLNNFLNQKYEESLGYPALRINFMAGMRVTIPSE